MADPERVEQLWAARLLARRAEKSGLRPRLAAAVIAGLWLVAIVVFGVVEHLVDPKSFETVWDGMWWATQTVTTVGYGDVVPDDGAGRVIASLLMIGGLSLFAVVTATITSAFVARSPLAGSGNVGPSQASLTEIEAQLSAVRAELQRLTERLDHPPRGDSGIASER